MKENRGIAKGGERKEKKTNKGRLESTKIYN